MKERKQIQVAFIIVSITAIFVGTFFFGLHYLNLSARTNSIVTTNTNTTLDVTTPDIEVQNQLIIIHIGQTVEVPRFELQVSLTQHAVTESSLSSILAVESTDQPSNTLHFTQRNETLVINGYEIRLVSATESAAQFAIQQL